MRITLEIDFPDDFLAAELAPDERNRVLDRYRDRVVPQPLVSIAESILAYWDRPTLRTERFALHALATAYRAGLVVLT